MSSSKERAEILKEELRDEREWKRTLETFDKFDGNAGLFGLTELTGLSCKPCADGWRWVIRARVNGVALVSFVDTVDIVRGYASVLDRLDLGIMKWYPDKYA